MTKTHAVRIEEHGGPEVLRWQEVEVGEPGPGQVRLKQAAVGLNFVDAYHRAGTVKVALPAILGMEAAGTVEAIGPGVAAVAVGDRVAYASAPMGAYSERRLYPADKLVKLPADIDERTAAAMMMQGLTAECLIRRVYPVRAGDAVLFHAAAGGVGSIAVQWLKALQAVVIGTVGSEEKAARARSLGCDHVINYRSESFAERVKEITGGKGVAVVYDGVGKDVFMASIDCLRPRGMMVNFGNVSGPAPAMEPSLLGQKGSLFLTRPALSHYVATAAELQGSAEALFDVVRSGKVRVEVKQTYPLRDAAAAHADLQNRKTVGSTVLVP